MATSSIHTDCIGFIKEVIHLMWHCFVVDAEYMHLARHLEKNRSNLTGRLWQCNILCIVKSIMDLREVAAA